MAEALFDLEIAPVPSSVRRLATNLDDMTARFATAMSRLFDGSGAFFVAFMKVRHLTGGTTADRLGVRSGTLRNALVWSVFGGTPLDGLTLRMWFLPNAPYAEVHERGSRRRGIPARLSFVSEFRKYQPTVIRDVGDVIRAVIVR